MHGKLQKAIWRNESVIELMRAATGLPEIASCRKFQKRLPLLCKEFEPAMIIAVFEGLTTVSDGNELSEMENSHFSIESFGCAKGIPAGAGMPIPQRSSFARLHFQADWNNGSLFGQDNPARKAA